MYVATWDFTTSGEDVEVTHVRQGEHFADDHVLVRLFPDKFRKVSDDSRAKRPDVEQATAAPGEKRGHQGGDD